MALDFIGGVRRGALSRVRNPYLRRVLFMLSCRTVRNGFDCHFTWEAPDESLPDPQRHRLEARPKQHAHHKEGASRGATRHECLLGVSRCNSILGWPPASLKSVPSRLAASIIWVVAPIIPTSMCPMSCFVIARRNGSRAAHACVRSYAQCAERSL